MTDCHGVRDGAPLDGDSGGRSLHDVERRLAEVELILAETQQLAELGSWSWHVATNTVSWSDELDRLLGRPPRELEPTFEAWLGGIHPDDLPSVSQTLQSVLEGRAERFQFDYRMVRPDGHLRWHRGRGQGVRDEHGSTVRLFGTVQDITASREVEQLLREQRDELAVLAQVVEATDDSVIVSSPDGTMLRWNPGAERLYGYTAEEAVGKHMSLILSAEQMARVPDLMAELAARGHVRTDSVDVRKDGTQVHTSITISRIGPIGGPSAIVGIARDVSEQKRSEEREREHARQLAWLAFHDQLTGLANRALLYERLGHALQRRGPHRIDVLLLDLDDFKTVNDVSGHAAGDQLLLEVARRLQACVRSEETVARLGGDEFAILLEDAEADAVADRVRQSLSEPISIGHRLVVPSASIGIGRNDDGTQDPDQLMLRADVAMYAAKADGKGRSKTFTADMADAIRDRADLEAALHQAVPRDEIVVHYQPIIDLKAASVSRVEALVRWRRPGGLVSPCQFVPLAESNGVIKEIGAEVLRQTLTTLRGWLSNDSARSVAVNISAIQLEDAGFAEQVLGALEFAGARAEQLVLEVTESLFLAQEPQLVEQLRALQRRGVRVSIDDFGTGYSSLGRLQYLPVDSIKIDKSFVDDLQTGHEDLPILTSMIVMAHNLGLDVTAEGVETATQADRLTALGCDYLQGYHFARPVPDDQLAAATHLANETTRTWAGARTAVTSPQR